MGKIRINYNIFIGFMFSFIYGYVNALGFVVMKGMFLTFMSGNSVKLGVDLGKMEIVITYKFFILFVCIVTGVFLGDFILSVIKKNSLIIIIGMELILFLISLILSSMYDTWEMLLPLVIAIGIQNIINMTIGNSLIGKSFITGMICNLGISLSKAVQKKGTWKQPFIYISAWMMFILGASIGTLIISKNNLFISILLITLFLAGVMVGVIILLKKRKIDTTYTL